MLQAFMSERDPGISDRQPADQSGLVMTELRLEDGRFELDLRDLRGQVQVAPDRVVVRVEFVTHGWFELTMDASTMLQLCVRAMLAKATRCEPLAGRELEEQEPLFSHRD